MLKLHPLYSSSSGNSYLIESPESKVLIDIGISFKTLTNTLESLGIQVSMLDAVFITHEHIDHIKGLMTFCSKTNIPVYTSKGTLDAIIEKYKEKIKVNSFKTISSGESIIVKDAVITPFDVSHDAKMPFGYTISSNDKTITIATDLGVVDENTFANLSKSDLSVIEANYDPNLLMYGNYPYNIKLRIQSELGHLSNLDTSNTIVDLAKLGKRDFLLGHVSENNNDKEQVLYEVKNSLKENGFDYSEFNINIINKDFCGEVYIL